MVEICDVASLCNPCVEFGLEFVDRFDDVPVGAEFGPIGCRVHADTDLGRVEQSLLGFVLSAECDPVFEGFDGGEI